MGEGLHVPTRADVARIAGVSESTVSYVLSGKRSISEETKKRVLAAIIQVGYKPNFAATMLARGSSRLVTMVVSNLFTTPSSLINGAVTDGMTLALRELGFHAVIWPVFDRDVDIELIVTTNFSAGVILMDVKHNDERLKLLNERNVPFVVLGRTEVPFEYNFVDRDFEAVGKIALTSLAELGHRKIGILLSGSSIPDHLLKSAATLKLKLYAIVTPNSLEGGESAVRRMKIDFPQVTGIVSLIDIATVGFVNAAIFHKVSIPSDISVIGINMLEEQAESANIKISTVKFDAFEMARSCGKMMVDVIEASLESKVRMSDLWTGDLVDRGSTIRVNQ